MIKRILTKKTLKRVLITDAVLLLAAIGIVFAVSEPLPIKGLKVEGSTYSTAKITWTEANDADGYRVFRAEGDGDLKYIGSTVDNSFEDTNLKTGAEYHYAVAARNNIKRSNINKNSTVKVTPVLQKPTLNVDYSKGEVVLNVSEVAGAIAYDFYRDGKEIGQSKENTFIDENAESDTVHKYEVKAVRYIKQPVYSEVSNSVDVELHSVSDMSFSATESTMTIDWEASDYYDDYKLYNGDTLLTETNDTEYTIEDYDSDKIYDIRLVGYSTDEDIQSPNRKKKIKVFEEPMDNEGAKKAACEWGVMIANDDSFAYGTGSTAHRCGCYFCGTNRSKKGAGYEKTYCCNPFVHACYAHGAGDPQMLRTCQNGGSVGMSSSDYTRYGNWENVGKPSISNLEAGDVLVSGGHVMMYIGDGQLVHAKDEGWGAGTITTDRCSSFYGMVSFVMRYQGTGSGTMHKVREVDDSGKPIESDAETKTESSSENA